MKRAFAILLAAFAALYVVAQVTLEGASGALRWATDLNPARKVQAQRFTDAHPGIRVTVEPAGDEKLLAQCHAGTGPDLIDLHQEQQMHRMHRAGILMDLTPHADRMGFGLDDTYPALRDCLSIDGRQYRFPCNVTANCIIYNRRVLDDHGVAVPTNGWTWNDFVRTAKAIRDTPSASGDEHLPLAVPSAPWMLFDLLVGHGARFYSDDGLTCTLDAPPAVAAMTLYHDLMHVHRVLPTPAEAAAVSGEGGWGTQGVQWFSTQRTAMIVIGRWYTVQLPHYPDLIGRLGSVRLPRVPGRRSVAMANTRGPGINVNTDKPHEAMLFLRYLASEEYNRLIIEDGDSLPPNPKYARTGADLVNAVAPDPSFHQTFIDAMETARPLDFSPFVDGGLVHRWLRERLGQVENRIARPGEAMASLAAEVNQRIRRNLAERPDLRERFRRVTGREWTADWWKETDR